MPEAAYEDATLRLVPVRNLMLAVWSDAPIVPQLKEFERVGQAMRKRFPGGTGLFNCVISGTPSFSPEVREEVTRLTRQVPMFSLSTAHIILLGGFAGVATRAFLSTVLLVSRSKQPAKVFGDRQEAVVWTERRINEGPEKWTRSELEDVLALVKT